MAHASNGTDLSDGTDLRAISYPSRNCRSRILNAAQSLRVETAEELLDWAERQPRGLRSLKRLHNFGDRSLNALLTGLLEAGIEVDRVHEETASRP